MHKILIGLAVLTLVASAAPVASAHFVVCGLDPNDCGEILPIPHGCLNLGNPSKTGLGEPAANNCPG